MEVHGYTETGSIDITLDDVRMTVPDNTANRHRQMVAEWEEAGNTIPAYVPPPPPIPSEISDRQFFMELAIRGLISTTEAEDAVAIGAIPASLLALIGQLPVEQQFPARMFLKGATRFERDHPMTNAIGAMYGLNSAQIDDLWRDAAQL